jgi:hypothetical protein
MTTTTPVDIVRLRSRALRSWSATRTGLRTRATESAARRQSRRELASLDRTLATVGHGNGAASRELRTMVIASFERTA